MTDVHHGAPPPGRRGGRNTASQHRLSPIRQGIAHSISATMSGLHAFRNTGWFSDDPARIRVTAADIPLARLPSAWDGLRIALLTDLHVGRFIGLDYLSRLVAITNAQHPDLIALGGDYVGTNDAVNESLRAVLAGLRAPAGRFACLGNHDRRHRPQRICEMFAAAGIEPLVNTGTILHRDGQALCLAGVDDCQEGWPDLPAALGGVPDDICRVLLCHNPDFADHLPEAPRVDLMLCGHTHGGQVRLPFIQKLMSPARNKRYIEGLIQGPRCPLYVSRGTGLVGLPFRYRCPAELPILTLRRSPPHAAG